MTTEDDKFWHGLARRVHKGEGRAIKPEEADALLSELVPDEVSRSEEDDIVAAVLSGVSLREHRGPTPEEMGDKSTDVLHQEASSVDEDVLQLNRNKGRDVEDPEAERLADELRREALEEDCDPSEPDEDEGEPRD